MKRFKVTKGLFKGLHFTGVRTEKGFIDCENATEHDKCEELTREELEAERYALNQRLLWVKHEFTRQGILDQIQVLNKQINEL